MFVISASEKLRDNAAHRLGTDRNARKAAGKGSGKSESLDKRQADKRCEQVKSLV